MCTNVHQLKCHMKVRIKRIDQTLPLPVYKTAGAVAFDLVFRVDETIAPGETKRVPCNVIIETPAGYALIVTPRSSMPIKKPGLIMPQGIGIIDQDYCGNDDEILLQLQNIGELPVEIKRGESISQAMLIKMERAEFEEVPELAAVSRGGYGSTDAK